MRFCKSSEPSHSPIICQVDPVALSNIDIALNYDQYMHTAYEQNPEEDLRAQKHYHSLQLAAGRWLLLEMERFVRKRRETNFALIGGSANPFGREFLPSAVDWSLSEYKTVLLVDISLSTLEKATKSLLHEIENGMNDDSVTCIEWSVFDITGGLGQVHDKLIRDHFDKVETGSDFRDAARNFRKDCERVYPAFRTSPENTTETSRLGAALNVPVSFQQNNQRRLMLSSGEPLHLVYMPMVAAGTGAASEMRIWNKLHAICGTEDWPRGAPTWHGGLRDIHHGIRKYNSVVALNFILDMIRQCPDCSVLVTTDVDTHFQRPIPGCHLRLNIPELCNALGLNGIRVSLGEPCTWEWDDDPNHWHTVYAFVCSAATRLK